MKRPFPDLPPEKEINRVEAFYQDKVPDVVVPPAVRPSNEGMDVVLQEELKSKLEFLKKNPARKDHAYRIAEIYYTVGELETSLTWLFYCLKLDPQIDPDLQRLIESVITEISQR